MRSGDYYEGLGVVLRREDEYPLGDISFLSPGWRRGGGHGTVFETTALFETSLDDLGKLAHAVAFLEADSSGGNAPAQPLNTPCPRVNNMYVATSG